MATCQEVHATEKRICGLNLGQTIEGQPNLCYFHGVNNAFEHIKGTIDRLKLIENALNNNENLKQYYEAIKNLKSLINKIPTVYEFNNIFNEYAKNNTLIDADGWYFPIEQPSSTETRLYQCSFGSDVKAEWIANVIFRNMRFYDLAALKRAVEKTPSGTGQESNHISDLNNEKISLINYADKSIVLLYQNINFWGDFEIHTPSTNIPIKILKSEVRSENFRIYTDNQLNIINTNISDKTTKVEICAPYTDLALSNSLVMPPLFGAEKTRVDLFDGYNILKQKPSKGNIEIGGSFLSVPAHTLRVPKEFLSEEQGQNGLIHNVNLHKVIFHNRAKLAEGEDNENLNKLDFVHCHFNEHKLFEDGQTIKRLLSNYRYLRKHFDEKGDYIEGNDFHYNYMECKRKLASPWDKAILLAYCWFNGYNTKPVRTIGWLFSVGLVTAFILFFSNYDVRVGSGTYSNIHASNIDFLARIGYGLAFSFQSLVPILKTDKYIPIDFFSSFVVLFNNITGPIFVTLSILAFRNRLRRSRDAEDIKS